MFLEIALINQDTGEVVYCGYSSAVAIKQAINNQELLGHAELMLKALQSYTPKFLVPRSMQSGGEFPANSAAPGATPHSSPGEDLGDNLNGTVDMGY